MAATRLALFSTEPTGLSASALPPDGVKVTAEMVRAALMLFAEMPTSVRRSLPVPVVWLKLMVLTPSAVADEKLPSRAGGTGAGGTSTGGALSLPPSGTVPAGVMV